MFTVPALSKKWRVACENLQPARDAFNQQNSTTDPADSAKWRKLAEIAARERKNNVAAMDVYAVQSKKCKSLVIMSGMALELI